MTLPTAVIADVDGTLCDVRSIRHHLNAPKRNFDLFHRSSADCPPNQQALDYVADAHAAGHQILVFTARTTTYRALTTAWLDEHLTVPYHGPLMRRDRDYRPDYIIKREMYDYATRTFNIVGAIDDNPAIVRLWESLDIPTITVPGWN